MTEWRISLKGDDLDLRELLTLSFAECSVTEERGEFILQSSEINKLTDSREVREHAIEMLKVLNGAAKLMHGNARSVELGGITSVGDDGRSTQHAFAEPAVVRVRAGRVSAVADGIAQEPQFTAMGLWVGLARSDSQVEEAFRLLGSRGETWENLHKLFEVVESDVGSEMFRRSWATKKEVSRFTQTANSAGAIGDDARHPAGKVSSPENPMALGEARKLVRRILDRWIRWKAQKVR